MNFLVTYVFQFFVTLQKLEIPGRDWTSQADWRMPAKSSRTDASLDLPGSEAVQQRRPSLFSHFITRTVNFYCIVNFAQLFVKLAHYSQF